MRSAIALLEYDLKESPVLKSTNAEGTNHNEKIHFLFSVSYFFRRHSGSVFDARDGRRRSARKSGAAQLHSGFGVLPTGRRKRLGPGESESSLDHGRQSVDRQGFSRRTAHRQHGHSTFERNRHYVSESRRPH